MEGIDTVGDGELNESILILEQILEVMPDDMLSRKALYTACMQNGQRERAYDVLVALSHAVFKGKDAKTAGFVVEQLLLFKDLHGDEVNQHIGRLQSLSPAGAAPKRTEPAPTAAKPAARGTVDIGEELTLAWNLYEENQLSQEEYSSVLHDLTEVSSKGVDVPVSVLHVLHDRGFSQMNRIVNYISSRSGVPVVSLASFELKEEMAGVLPMELPMHGGALPFAFFGNHLLVAVLNPYNNQLVDQVEKTSCRRCHTFLAMPEDYDAALGRLRKLAKG